MATNRLSALAEEPHFRDIRAPFGCRCDDERLRRWFSGFWHTCKCRNVWPGPSPSVALPTLEMDKVFSGFNVGFSQLTFGHYCRWNNVDLGRLVFNRVVFGQFGRFWHRINHGSWRKCGNGHLDALGLQWRAFFLQGLSFVVHVDSHLCLHLWRKLYKFRCLFKTYFCASIKRFFLWQHVGQPVRI